MALQAVPLLLLCGFDDQVNRESVLNAMLTERISIFQNLTSKNKNQLVLLRLKSFGNLFFELFNRKKIVKNGVLHVIKNNNKLLLNTPILKLKS